MKHIIRYSFLLFVIILFYSCNSNKKESSSFTRESFQSSYKLHNGKCLEISDTTLMRPCGIDYHPEGYLILLDRRSDYLVKIINVKTGVVQKIVRKGRGPNECITPWNVSIVNNDVWIYGTQLKKMLLLKLNSDGAFRIAEEVNIEVHSGGCIALNDSLFANTPSTKDRVSYVDRQGKLINSTGGFPKGMEQGENLLPNTVFQTKMTASPDGKYVALANLSVDALEIYSYKGDIICTKRGPDGIDVTVKPNNNDGVVSYPLDPRFFAYNDIAAVNNEIWASYSGVEWKKGEPFSYINSLPNQIYCFSWQGKPIRKIELDIPFSNFAIDKSNMKLYCLVHNPEIKVFEYDISNIKI